MGPLEDVRCGALCMITILSARRGQYFHGTFKLPSGELAFLQFSSFEFMSTYLYIKLKGPRVVGRTYFF